MSKQSNKRNIDNVKNIKNYLLFYFLRRMLQPFSGRCLLFDIALSVGLGRLWLYAILCLREYYSKWRDTNIQPNKKDRSLMMQNPSKLIDPPFFLFSPTLLVIPFPTFYWSFLYYARLVKWIVILIGTVFPWLF